MEKTVPRTCITRPANFVKLVKPVKLAILQIKPSEKTHFQNEQKCWQ